MILRWQARALGAWLLLCAAAAVIGEDRWKVESKPLSAQARRFLDRLTKRNLPAWESMTPREARTTFTAMDDMFGHGPSDVKLKSLSLDGRISARLYKPAAAAADAPPPAVVFFHGGGWVTGDIDTHDAVCRRLAHETPCAVVSVDYRRAPESHYPAALDDCYDATSYVAKHAAELGIDGTRLAVMGDSAGGNLAAAVALRSRDQHGPQLVAQVLIYPVVDDTCSSASYSEYARGYGLTKANMEWYWKQYLGEATADELAAPSRAESLRGLPPAFVITAEYDVLRDEGEAYARRMRDEGNDVRLWRVGGTVHGFVHFAAAFDVGLETTTGIARELASRFKLQNSGR